MILDISWGKKEDLAVEAICALVKVIPPDYVVNRRSDLETNEAILLEVKKLRDTK